MSDVFRDISEFHAKFNLPKRVIGTPPGNELLNFRVKFILEELQELNVALGRRDLVEALDALVDIVYVAVGTAYCLNLPFDEAWAEVHRSNMAKVRADDPKASKRGSTLDVVKPIGWLPPNLQQFISEEDQMLKVSASKDGKSQQLDLVEYLSGSHG